MSTVVNISVLGVNQPIEVSAEPVFPANANVWC